MITTNIKKIELYRKNGWWNDRTVGDLFDGAVANCPDKLAVIDPPNRDTFTDGPVQALTFAQLAEKVCHTAATLVAHGVGKEDIVVVQMPNIVDVIVLYLALAKIGAVISPVPVQYGCHELKNIAQLTEAKAFVSVTNFKGKNLLAIHGSLFSSDAVPATFCSAQNGDGGWINLAEPATAAALEGYREYQCHTHISADDIVTLCWTSGTTGRPKGVPRSHNHGFSQAVAALDSMQLDAGDAMLNPFPFVNMASFGGFFFTWLAKQACLVLHHPLDLALFLKQLEAHKVVFTIVPPVLLSMLLKQREELLGPASFSQLRVIGTGGAPISGRVIIEYKNAYGIDIINFFASNEGCPLVSSVSDVPDPEKRAIYFPRFGVEKFQWTNRMGARIKTKLVDVDTGVEIITPGKPGELQIWGPTVFDGYFKSPQDNAQAFTRDGFFRTGDLFEIAGCGEDERFYRFTGRCKDVIIRGGMKISPEELDILLSTHDNITEAAVMGYPDEFLGERVCAVVVPRHGAAISLDEIIRFLQEHQIAVIKLPEKLIITDALPRNSLGKVVRGKLRELLSDSDADEQSL